MSACLAVFVALSFVALSGCSSSSLSVGEERPDETYRKVVINPREHGYRGFESIVVSSPDELKGFLEKTAAQEGWNDQQAFQYGIEQAEVEFPKEVLVLLRHTARSGGTRVRLERPELVFSRLRFRVDSEEPLMGTADMAYYCFAFAVDRSRIREVELLAQGMQLVVLPVPK